MKNWEWFEHIINSLYYIFYYNSTSLRNSAPCCLHTILDAQFCLLHIWLKQCCRTNIISIDCKTYWQGSTASNKQQCKWNVVITPAYCVSDFKTSKPNARHIVSYSVMRPKLLTRVNYSRIQSLQWLTAYSLRALEKQRSRSPQPRHWVQSLHRGHPMHWVHRCSLVPLARHLATRLFSCCVW